MVKYLILFAILILGVSCEKTNPNRYDTHSLASALNQCEGVAVVVTTGCKGGIYEAATYHIILRDSTGSIYEYIGAKMNVEIEDTLKY